MDEKEATRLAEGIRLLCLRLECLKCVGGEVRGWPLFFDILASSALPLQGLSLRCFPDFPNDWDWSAVHEILRQVGRLRNVRSLDFGVLPNLCGDRLVDLSPLSSLCQLQELKADLPDFDVLGVQAALSSCHQVTSLRFAA
jgi:hypothetical protein